MLCILISSYPTHLLNALILNFVNNTAVHAIVDSGAPFNNVTTWLCKKLNILPDLDCAKEFGTAGQFSTTLQVAFSALLLCLVELLYLLLQLYFLAQHMICLLGPHFSNVIKSELIMIQVLSTFWVAIYLSSI